MRTGGKKMKWATLVDEFRCYTSNAAHAVRDAYDVFVICQEMDEPFYYL